MPSTVRRTANKASSGVNKEHQYYCESKLKPSNSKKAPTKDLLSSSSLTPPHHNQAHGVTNNAVDEASANTNTSVRRSKRGRRSAKHGNSKRRATNNECPGSAISVSSSNADAAGTVYYSTQCDNKVSSSNANAAGTVYYSTQCDNKENCPPVEESWHQPSLEESWPTPLKSTLVVLDKCLISSDARRAVIELFIKAEPLNKVEYAILKWLTVLGGDDKGKKFKGEVDVARRRLAKVLGRVANGKYRGRVNLGDVLQELVSVIILKHYAPYSCKGYTDGGEYNLIDRDNVCIKAFHLLIARSLHKEGGGVWTDDVAKSVNDNIAFTDLRVILPNKKDTHQKEFNTFAKDCDISPGLCDLIGFLGYASQVKYHYLLHGTPVKVVVASAECNRVWFDERARTATPYVIFLSYVPHGQCWAMRLPLMNRLVHRDEMLPLYNERLVAAFEDIVQTPDVSMITHRFGARLGNDQTFDEWMAQINCNSTANAWKAVFGGKATEKQEKLVYNSTFYILMMAWAALNDGHADKEQMKLLENDLFYKTKMAWKAFNDGHADKEQMKLLEKHQSYELKMAWKAFNDGSFTKDQMKLLENDLFYKTKMAWKAFNDGHADKEQMKLLEKHQSYELKMAWKAFNDGSFTKDQMKLLENDLFYKTKMAWKAFNDGHADKEQMKLLEKHQSYELKMAWKAFNDGSFTKDQKELLENDLFYKLKMAWKAFNDGNFTKDQKELLEKHQSYKLKMAWKAFNDGSFTKDQKELLEKNHFYKLKMAQKAKKEGVANNVQLALIEKSGHGKPWSHEDHCRLIKAHFGYGKNWVAIASYVKNRTNNACRDRAKVLLPKHSYICSPNETWLYYNAKDRKVYGPYSNNGMCEWVRRGLPGDTPIRRSSIGGFGPMGLYFTDSSWAFLSIDKMTDAVDETNALVEEKALKFFTH